MKIEDFFPKEGEKPLEMLKEGGGMCSILRTVACIGDSLSSGEHESFEMGEKGFHDYFDYSWGQFMARDAGITVQRFIKSTESFCTVWQSCLKTATCLIFTNTRPCMIKSLRKCFSWAGI